MAVTIAHLSDLHFGMKSQTESWRPLTNFLANELRPDLVLVTGDLADSAQEGDLTAARDGMRLLRDRGIKCLVCAGNHDRHLQGIATHGAPTGSKSVLKELLGQFVDRISPKDTSAGGPVNPAKFDTLFNELGMLAPLGAAVDIALPLVASHGTRWRVRVLALDSSIRAEYAAQGFVDPEMLRTLREAARHTGDDLTAPDLVVVLVHHHLLPVSSLEVVQRQSFNGLFASTILLNAGTVLETLVDVGADLILHGHEHAKHHARYGSMASGRTDLAVIGAASATGADTKEGCRIAHSSFNLLTLGDDLSVTLQELHYRNGTWEPTAGGTPLMGAVDIRRSRYLRKQAPGALPSSRVLKQFVYTPSRDAIIRQVTTNYLIDRQRFSVETRNASGTPYFMGGFVELPTGETMPLNPAVEPMRAKNGGHFEYEQILVGLDPGRAVVRRIEHEIAWLAGGVLTQDDIKRCGSNGEIREGGREFVEMQVEQSLESLTLSIELPLGLGPQSRSDVEVLVRPPLGRAALARSELTERLRFSGLNRIAVNIPFPMAGYSYLVALRLPNIPPVDQALKELYGRMSSLAREVAFDIVANLANLAPGPKFSVGVYIPDVGVNGLGFQLVGHAAEEPPRYVSLSSNQHPFCSAHWGVPKILYVTNPGQISAEETALGVQADEAGMILLPLPGFLGGATRSPCPSGKSA